VVVCRTCRPCIVPGQERQPSSIHLCTTKRYLHFPPPTRRRHFYPLGRSAAYSGYTRAKANIVQPNVSGGQAPITYTARFEEGKYYPMRVIWANGGGDGWFSFELKGPDGKVIIDASTTEPSPFLVQYSCDETTAPRFAPFGSET
jgi:hypothetical protein